MTARNGRPTSRQPTPDHERLRDDLLALWNVHAGHLDSWEMLAVAAVTVGQMIAFMDKDAHTSEEALQLVLRNIREGNASAIASGLPQSMGQ